MSPHHENLASLRREARSVPLITGATGFVGSHLAVALLRRGLRLKLLARGRRDQSALARLRRTLAWHDTALDDRVEVVEGDVAEPRFGLGEAEFAALASSTTEIIHCASSTSFSDKRRLEIEKTNIEGTRQCLELARTGRIAHVHYISTAFVAGTMKTCPETLVEPPGYHNCYESSKNVAEHMVVRECEAARIGWTIYRPSVVIGDAGSGRTLLFNAMYYPVRFFDHMRSVIRRDCLEGTGANARAMNARLDADDKVHLPTRFNKGSEVGGLINLVPVDYVTRAFEAIYFGDACHGVYNLVADEPSRLESLLGHIERYFGIVGLRAVTADQYRSCPLSPLDSALATFAEVYLPYMADERTFASARLRGLPGFGEACSAIDYPTFERCIDYAVECGWKSPLHAPTREKARVAVS